MAAHSDDAERTGDLAGVRVDTTVPHPARRYDYWLGGKDNYTVDRESGDAIAAAFPTIRVAVQENRAFLRRAMEFLAGQDLGLHAAGSARARDGRQRRLCRPDRRA